MDNSQTGSNEPTNENVSRPIFETVPVSSSQAEGVVSSKAEEVGEGFKPSRTETVEGAPTEKIEPEIVTEEQAQPSVQENVVPEEIGDGLDLNNPQEEGNHKTRIVLIIGGVVFFIVIFFLLFKVLSGFFSVGGGIGGQKVTLTYWGLWENKSVMEPLIKEYTKKNPNVTINYEKKDPHSYREKLLARSKEGNGPDLFRFHNTWLPSIKDILSPLPKSVMSSSEFESTFYPITKKDLKVGDQYFGIPLEIDGLVLLYNDDLFKIAGLSVAPKTWEDVLANSAKLTVKGPSGIITSGIALGTAENIEHFSEILGFMLLQNNAKLSNLTAPEAVEILSVYRGFAQEPNPRWDENMPNSITAFIQGKVAMIFVPSWEILPIKTIAPDLHIKVTSLPIVPGGKQLAIADYWVEGVSRYQPAAHQQEAWKFLHFLSQKENMSKLYANATRTRPFGEPYSRVDMRSLLTQDPYVGPVMEEASFMQSMPLMSRTYDNGLNDAIVRYLKNAVNDTVKGVGDAEAFGTASKGVSEVLHRFGIQ